MNKDLRDQLIAMIKKSQRALAAAKDHLDNKDYDFASSKAYYTVFHALQAILLTKNLTFSKHSGVISAFNQHFIKTGVFPKEFSRQIERLFKDRQIGDYDYKSALGIAEAEEDISTAKNITKAIAYHLKLK